MEPMICQTGSRGEGRRPRRKESNGRAAYGGVGRLRFVLVRDGSVHVDETQEVEAQRRRQAAEEPKGAWAAKSEMTSGAGLAGVKVRIAHMPLNCRLYASVW